MLVETSITEFHEKYYTTAIQKLVFNFPCERILGTRHCGKERCEAFKLQVNLNDIL